MALNRRLFIKGLVATAAVTTGTSAYAAGVERHDIAVEHVPLDLGLGRKLRLVALSDIHFDPLYEIDYLTSVTSTVSGLNADLIVYTGDFFSHDSRRADELATILASARSRLGSFAIMGNHDFWSKESRVQRSLETHGIRVLRNESVPIPDFDQCYLSGLDSFWAGKPDPLVIEKTPKDARHILLVHEPDPFDRLDNLRIKLQISGHTHGGQIRAPFYGALILPSWGRKYDQGLFRRDGRYLYVNRGIGSLRPYMRFNCRPEVTCFDLT